MPMNALLRWGACCLSLCLGLGTAIASVDCNEPSTPEARNSDSSAGRQYLGQGISLYETRKLELAEKALQASLFAGLTDGRERSTAHKYLAFIYCTNREWTRCDTAFNAAFDARPSFTLEAYELQNTPWRDAYAKAYSQRGAKCGRSLASFSNSQGSSPGNSNALTFSLNSTVITAITPLLAVAGYPTPSLDPTSPMALGVRRPMRSENNILLRVSPWAHVTLNGKRVGVTPPLTELKLPPGSHNIELSNPGFDTVRKTLKVEPDQPITITHDFDAR